MQQQSLLPFAQNLPAVPVPADVLAGTKIATQQGCVTGMAAIFSRRRPVSSITAGRRRGTDPGQRGVLQQLLDGLVLDAHNQVPLCPCRPKTKAANL